jgi:hypothetical protein
LTTFLNSPDNERLTTTAITSGEDSFHIGRVAAFGSRNVGTGVSFDAETFGTVFWTKESHAQEDQIGREKLLGVWELRVGPLTLLILLPIKSNSLL